MITDCHISKKNTQFTGRRTITKSEFFWSKKLTGQFKATTCSEILTVFKKVSSELNISDSVFRFIELLIKWTRPVDWEENGFPLVWLSNQALCDILGYDLRKLQRIRKKAIDAGLITMCEVGTSKRWGKRKNNDPDQAVIAGCGFNLSPLAERREEFEAIIRDAESYRKQRDALKFACHGWKRKILNLLDYAGHDDKASIMEEIASFSNQLKRCLQDIKTLMQIEYSLQKIFEKTEAAVNDEIRENNVDMSPKDDKNVTLYTNTNKHKIYNNVIAQKTNSSQIVDKMISDQDALNGFIISPTLILKIASLFRDWISDRVTWSDLENVAPCVLYSLGIHQSVWKEACDYFGIKQAITALAIVNARHDKGLVKSAGGLFRSFIKIHKKNELHLDKTLYGLITK